MIFQELKENSEKNQNPAEIQTNENKNFDIKFPNKNKNEQPEPDSTARKESVKIGNIFKKRKNIKNLKIMQFKTDMFCLNRSLK